MAEYDRWETRYGAPEYIFGEAPNAFLASCAALLPAQGAALAVADGEGRNGVWLAERGLDVTSVDFSPTGQAKAAALAKARGVPLRLVRADVHAWNYPEEAFDVVAEIFTQFSEPKDRRLKWDGMKRALKRGGLLILQGYTPRQLHYGTGGPKQLDHLYTRELMEAEFAGWRDLRIEEQEIEMHEGPAHSGMSAVINLTARKP
ncbi:MAG TPA: class I SAM-dependent methyltransferase [Beijerinckiaceae bacterium]|jgi:SAM-dependent methyltransferase